MGMRLEKKTHWVILHWGNASGSPCADAAFPLPGERTAWGVAYSPTIWCFNCKLSWADADALQMPEHRWLFTVNVSARYELPV